MNAPRKNQASKREVMTVMFVTGLVVATFGSMLLRILGVEFSIENIILGMFIVNASWMIREVVK